MIGDFVEAMRLQMGVDASIWIVGDFARGMNGAPPRYVWVPTRDTIGPFTESGGFAARLPRPLLTRRAGVDCHVWGASLAATETMVHALIAAAHLTLGAYGEYDGVQWQPEAMNASGVLAIVSFVIPIPITAESIEEIDAGQFTTIECDDAPPATPDGFVECCEEIDP